MAVLNLNTATPPRARNSRATPFGTTAEERPRSQLWLNIGYETNGKFISLPFGLPLDNMNEADTRSQNSDYVKQQMAKNALLAQLKAAGAGLQPGQEVTVNLELRLRRVNDDLAISSNENEYAVDFTGLLSSVPAPALVE